MALSCSNQKPAGGKVANDSYNRGVEALEKNEFDQAIADFTEAIRLDPKLALAYHNRGAAYSNKGDNDKPIAVWM
jgi:Tfp pilus assembly protein PilF